MNDQNKLRITSIDPDTLPAALPWSVEDETRLTVIASSIEDGENTLERNVDWQLDAGQFSLLTDQTGRTIVAYYTPDVTTKAAYTAVRFNDLSPLVDLFIERFALLETILDNTPRVSLGINGKMKSLVPDPGKFLSWGTGESEGQLINSETNFDDVAAGIVDAAETAASAADAATTAAAAAGDDAADAALSAEQALSGRIVFRGPWLTATPITRYSLYTFQGKTYHAETDHMSGVFATDLAAGHWSIFAESTFDINARLPVLTTGTATAYAVTLPDPPPALFVGLAGIIRFNAETGTSPTIDINGLGAVPLQIRNEAGALESLTVGLFGANETASFVVQPGFVVEITSQPGRQLIAGPSLLPLASQAADWNTLIEGAHSFQLGVMTNGPMGAAAFDYGAANAFGSIHQRAGFIFQTVYMMVSGALREWRRTGLGDPLTFGAWGLVGSSFDDAIVIDGTTGANILIQNIPPSAQRFILDFNNVVPDTSEDSLFIQLGTSAGLVVTGYENVKSVWLFGNESGDASATTGFLVDKRTGPTGLGGHLEFIKTLGNRWSLSGVLSEVGSNGTTTTSGSISLPGPLTQCQLSWGNSGDFGSGSIIAGYVS